MANDKKLTYGEVKTSIHRLNERMRYTFNKYGANATITEELEKEMHRVIIGSGVHLTTNKKGIAQIRETEANINKLMSINLLPKDAREFRGNVENASPDKIYKKQVKQYIGDRTVKGQKRKDVASVLNVVKPQADAFTKLLNKLLDHRLISSSTVNTIHRDEQGSKRIADEIYKRFVQKGYSFNSERDLEEMSEYIHSDPVSVAYHSRRNWNDYLVGGTPTIQANVGGAMMDVPENVRSYTSDGPYVRRAEMDDKEFNEYMQPFREQRANEVPFGLSKNNPFGNINKASNLKKVWKKFE